ncbi:MAG: HemK/PrmC family methyltransferase [Candidatus Saccharimonadales bacterium]
MNVSEWLKISETKLTNASISTPRLDCLVLLEDETDKDRGWLLAHPEFILSSAQENSLNTKITQRLKHVPLAYIRGFTEFYGRQFIITPAVLEPRPESETMIEMLLSLPNVKTKPYRIADVGTGSGALGITAKLELPNLEVDLLEIDKRAILVTQKNVIKFATNVNTLISDLLDKSSKDYDILLCNLPYVPDDFRINSAAMNEPRLAIFGGPDGLDIYRRMFSQINISPKKPMYILCESMPPQHITLESIARSSYYELIQTSDFIQLFTNLPAIT